MATFLSLPSYRVCVETLLFLFSAQIAALPFNRNVVRLLNHRTCCTVTHTPPQFVCTVYCVCVCVCERDKANAPFKLI